MSDVAFLRAAGAALHGDRWQVPLSRDLGVSDRSVRRWDAGTAPVPDRVEEELVGLLEARKTAIGGMIEGWRRKRRDLEEQIRLLESGEIRTHEQRLGGPGQVDTTAESLGRAREQHERLGEAMARLAKKAAG